MWINYEPHIFLVVVMGVIFFIDNILGLIFGAMGVYFSMSPGCPQISQPLTAFMSLPVSLSGVVSSPWSIISYIFLHGNLWHIFFNAIALYFTGSIMMGFYRSDFFYRSFLASGIGGAILTILLYNLYPGLSIDIQCSYMVGASASIMGILTISVLTAPRFPVFFFFIPIPMPFWVAYLIIVLIDIISIGGPNTGGHIAHIGGAMTGALIFYMRRINWKKWFKKRHKKNKVHRYYPSYVIGSSHSRDDYDEDYLNRILDKIATHGINSLTREELEYLEKYSKHIQGH